MLRRLTARQTLSLSTRSASLDSRRPLSDASIFRQTEPIEKARRAACTALSTSACGTREAHYLFKPLSHLLFSFYESVLKVVEETKELQTDVFVWQDSRLTPMGWEFTGIQDHRELFSSVQNPHQGLRRCAVYLVGLLDFTDLLSGRRVARRKHLPTDRVLPLVVDENLQRKNAARKVILTKRLQTRGDWTWTRRGSRTGGRKTFPFTVVKTNDLGLQSGPAVFELAGNNQVFQTSRFFFMTPCWLR